MKLVFLGHVIGGWPSNWDDGSLNMRKVGDKNFRKLEGDDYRH